MGSIKLQESFPLLYSKLYENCKDMEPLYEQHRWFWWRKILILTKEQVKYKEVMSSTEGVSTRLLSLCEDILKGEIELGHHTIKLGDTYYSSGFTREGCPHIQTIFKEKEWLLMTKCIKIRKDAIKESGVIKQREAILIGYGKENSDVVKDDYNDY